MTALMVDRKLRVRMTAGWPVGDSLLDVGLVDAIGAPEERRRIERAARLALGGQTSEIQVVAGIFGSRRLTFTPIDGRLNGGSGVHVSVEPPYDTRLKELETRARDLATLTTASSRLARASDSHQVAEIVCETASDVASGDFAALLEPHGSESALQVTASTGAKLEGLLPIEPWTLASSAFQSGRQMYSDRLRHLDPDASWPIQSTGAYAAIWQPVRYGGGVRAVLVVGWRRRLTVPGHRIKASIELLADEAAVTLERAASVRRLQLMARTDSLTSLYNRRAWEDELARELSRAGRNSEQLSIGLIDVDHLKRLNDLYGHSAGDQLLMTAAARWRRRLRVTDVLARIGGDEFAMTLPNCSAAEAVSLGNELRGVMPAGFSCSVGVAEWVADEPEESLLARADRALYAAKHQGRDRTIAAPGPGVAAA